MTSALPSDEVAEDYKNSLEDLTLNSRYEISNLTVIAKENMDHALAISRVLENHIRNAPPSRKLPALYVLDSVVKNVGTPYTLFFGRNLYQTFMNAYSLVDGPVRKKLEEMLKTWKEPVPGSLDSRPVFPVDVTRNIENALIKARTAAVQLQQQQARVQPGRGPSPWRGTSTPPLHPLSAQATDASFGRQQQPGYAQHQGQPNGSDASYNGLQPTHHQQHPPSQPMLSHLQPGGYPQAAGSVDTLSHDIANLIASARAEFASNPYDQGVQERLKALLDLQSIVQSQTLPADQLRLIKDQVAQLSLTSRPPPTAVPVPLPAQAPQAPPQQSPSLESLFPPNALAALLAAVPPAQQPTPPPPQAALPVSQPPNMFNQPLSVPTPPPPPVVPSATPAGGESSLVAQLRAAGLLPPTTTTPSITPALPATLPILSAPPSMPLNNGAPHSNNVGREAWAKIPNNVELTSVSLKIPRPHLISSLYEAQSNQCTTCGRRFPATEIGRAKKARHLDWHFRVNLRMGEAAKRGQNRSWYVGEVEWIRSRDNDENADANVTDEAGVASGDNTVARKAQRPWIPVPNDPAMANVVCPIDQEKFETVWHDEAQEWVWMDAVRVGDKIYHASCYAEATKDGVGAGAPPPVSGASVLGKRKAEESELFPLRAKPKTEVA